MDESTQPYRGIFHLGALEWQATTGFRSIPISISIFLDVSIFFSGQTNIAPPLVHPIGFLPNLLDGSVFTPLKSI